MFKKTADLGTGGTPNGSYVGDVEKKMMMRTTMLVGSWNNGSYVGGVEKKMVVTMTMVVGSWNNGSFVGDVEKKMVVDRKHFAACPILPSQPDPDK